MILADSRKQGAFRQSLKEARIEVATWPKWKQLSLGGGPALPKRKDAMTPCRHFRCDHCDIDRRPMDCACRSYDGSPNMPSNVRDEWDRLMADRGSDRALGLYVLTHAAIGGVILATIGVTAMMMGGWR